MLNLIVCVKQVPMVTELPWDEKSKTLRRDLAPGIMNPACKHALEAALQVKERFSANITVMTMGPPMSEEILREALALGADKAILICDRLFAGADTFATSWVLKQAIQRTCPRFDLVLCGAYTVDSETGQVGPQLAEELDVPSVAYVENMEICGQTLRVRRLVDNFRETLEMHFPALVTISMENYKPRYTSLAGLEEACERREITVLNALSLGIDSLDMERNGSRTKVRKVFLKKEQKQSLLIQGSASMAVTEFLDKYQREIGAIIGKSIEGKKHNDEK